MVIERADHNTNIYEMKFDSEDEYAIDNTEAEKIRKRLKAYKEQTGSRNGLYMTLITTYGLKHNMHSDVVDNVITLDELFA
jgi:hypothetical protein